MEKLSNNVNRGGQFFAPSENLFSLLEQAKECTETVKESIVKAWNIVNSDKYRRIFCSIAGGADSDVMLDMCMRIDKNHKIDYVWFDTGLEYSATKEHLVYLENKYGIEFRKEKAIVPIPSSCKQYGQPFMSKKASDMISRLQSHGFQFEDKPFEELYKKYPNCKSALRWWTNDFGCNAYNIRQNKLLKEFMVENPPQFNISSKCCDYAKKKIAHKIEKEYDLNLYGVRKSEGGIRSNSYKTCFDSNGEFRPIFWFKEADKESYCATFRVTHSKCYTEYGLPRTGCAGCPYARGFENELEVINKYEPKLYKVVNHIFKDSYEYTRQYWKFRRDKENNEKV